jgi:hypothetical protein
VKVAHIVCPACYRMLGGEHERDCPFVRGEPSRDEIDDYAAARDAPRIGRLLGGGTAREEDPDEREGRIRDAVESWGAIAAADVVFLIGRIDEFRARPGRVKRVARDVHVLHVHLPDEYVEGFGDAAVLVLRDSTARGLLLRTLALLAAVEKSVEDARAHDAREAGP